MKQTQKENRINEIQIKMEKQLTVIVIKENRKKERVSDEN